jgi:hypothetical protein
MNKLCLIIMFIFLSCNNRQDKKQKSIIPKTMSNKIVDSTTIDANSLFNIANQKSFNVEKYKLDLDAILNGINKNFKTTIKIDTIKDGNFLDVNFRSTCFEKINTETKLITKHSFSINDEGKRLNHYVIIFEFDSIKKLETNYDCMKTEALNTPAPGLSYANDYVTFSNNKIYWINSSCMFSYSNHNKFVDVFKKNMKINETNSIQCECGKVICSISDR